MNHPWTVLVFFGIFEIGSVLCGAAVSSLMFIVGLFVAAGIRYAPLHKRPGDVGRFVDERLLGFAIGPLIGGAFTSYTTWRWSGGLATIAIALLRLQGEAEKPKAWSLVPNLHRHLDLIGFFLLAPATLQLLLALQFGGVNYYPWNSSQVIGLFVGAFATGVIWFFWNRYRGEDVLTPRALISRGSVLATGLYTALHTSAVYGAIYFLPLYFQGVNRASALLSTVYLLPMILAQLFTAAAGIACYVMPVAIFSSIFLSVGSGLYSILQPSSSTGKWVGFQILGGIGSGAGLRLSVTSVQAAMGVKELASGIAFVIFCENLDPTIALTLTNVIFSSSLPKELS
ncbi:hypothetical protein EKO27_g6301 [Xylaria grammica]|uniref:Major facilitator superfamily (MFS) profile domain-containing protein n=1 Tax=Xylaria grammica TaxID=363999 RepID=A0A439D305_9PEZI|nr:hypothetical protein EKO27_g6301 [Xylaria grammica]